MIDEWIPVISNVGFPISMCIYFVVRFEKILTNNTTALRKILEVITKCSNR